MSTCIYFKDAFNGNQIFGENRGIKGLHDALKIAPQEFDSNYDIIIKLFNEGFILGTSIFW
jgi:hypothetical protein